MSAGIGKCRFCNGSVGRETSVRIFPDGSYFFGGKKPFIRGGVCRLDFGRTGKTSFAGCPLMIEIKKTCNKRLHFGGGRVIKIPSLFSAALLLKPRSIRVEPEFLFLSSVSQQILYGCFTVGKTIVVETGSQ